MKQSKTTRRGKQRAAVVCVAALGTLAYVFVCYDAWAQVVENAEVKRIVSSEEEREERYLKENARRVYELEEESFLETRAVFYPTELAWGDAAYFATVERNLDAKPRKIYAPSDFEIGKNFDFDKIAVTSPDVNGEYVYQNNLARDYQKETSRDGHFDTVLVRKTIEVAPGEERFRVRTALEFPPLEDANDPFWTAVRRKLDAGERVILRLNVNFDRTDESFRFYNDVFETEVAMNKRVDAEMKTLDRWGSKIPKETLQARAKNGSSKASFSKGNGGRGNFESDEEYLSYFKAKTYYPWDFIRVENREISAPNNPTELDDWRKLEGEFAPSTLRDEITFVRMQLEYYSASSKRATSDALNALIAWLKARPEAQRAVWAATVDGKSRYFKQKGLEAKYRALVEAVEGNAASWGPNRKRFADEEANVRSASRIYEAFPPRPPLFEVETRYVVWPREAFWGDVAYFAAIERNVSPTLGGSRKIFDFEILKRLAGTVEIEAEGVGAKHRYFQELWEFNPDGGQDKPATLLPPKEERAFMMFAFEFPPLEDWNDPFWTAVREKLAVEKRVPLRCRFRCWNGASKPALLETEIVLKERPNKELETIAGWFDATPTELLPERVGQFTVKTTPRKRYETGQIIKSGAEGIELDASGELFSPWLFLRVGNRKPSDPNNPTTVAGWRALESEFEASTLRDEITFVRMQVEYYAATTDEESEGAANAFVAWLAARPEAQRTVLAASVFAKARQFAKTRLNAKYVALVEAIRNEPEIARLLEKRDCVAKPTKEATDK